MSGAYRGILSAMKGRTIQYKSGKVWPDWSWHPEQRARKLLEKARRENARHYRESK
jgi:hypothetical protein